MGGAAHVLVVGGRDLTQAAHDRILDLEARWSRFRADSELSLLNGMPGMPIIVSPETYELVDKAVFGWRQTRGRFDPTMLPALVAVGYDRSFELLAADSRQAALSQRAAPGCAGIVLDPADHTVTLPLGVTIDPGGIGKGLAADIVVRELRAAGADGAMVNLGGDVRVVGRSPEGIGWTVSVEDPFDESSELTRVHLVDGAVATSSRLLRRWRRNGADVHHLIDPATGGSMDGDVAAVTVVAGEAWWAEIMAKAAFAAGPAGAASVLVNAAALVVDMNGQRHATPGFVEVAA